MTKCVECGKILTADEKKDYYTSDIYCCDGAACCCMGKPTEPPYCNDCLLKGDDYNEK